MVCALYAQSDSRVQSLKHYVIITSSITIKLRVRSILPPFDCDKTYVYSDNQLVSSNDYYYITPMIKILIRRIIIVTGNPSLITMSSLNCNLKPVGHNSGDQDSQWDGLIDMGGELTTLFSGILHLLIQFILLIGLFQSLQESVIVLRRFRIPTNNMVS